MAAPAYQGGDVQTSSAAQSLTMSISASGATTGDLMIAFMHQSENTGEQLWDDDGGGGNGWTLEVQNRTTSGRDMECAIYWKFHDGSESDPTFTWDVGGVNEPMTGILLAYDNVDTVEPFQGPTYLNATNDCNPPNPSVDVVYANTRVVCFHAATHDDISSVGAPTGFTIRDYQYGGSAGHTLDHQDTFTADIEIDTVGSYTPPDWTHGASNTTPEYQTYTMALNEVQPIHITGGTALDNFLWVDTNLTLTGDGFEATQNTGKVEYWSDEAGTVKTAQSIDSWSDTSIQLDATQGSLANNTFVWLVVTNHSGDVSKKVRVAVGLLGFADLIKGWGVDHYWELNNTYADTGITGPTRDMDQGVVGTFSFATTPICDGNTHVLVVDDAADRREIADSPNMNITISAKERTVGCWLMLPNIEHPLSSLWKEGGGVQNLAILVGYGNVLLWQMADVAGTRDNVQAWSDIRLTPNRPYFFCGYYSHLDTTKEARMFLDDVKQSDSDGNPMTIGIFDSHSGDVTWFDSDNSLETGGTDILYNGPSALQMSDFFSFSDNSTGPDAGRITDANIQLAFRRGAPPDDIIETGTESAMQTALDATADTRPDWPLSYRIEPVTGGGDFELIMTDKVFDDRITKHVDYRGTDTLTLVNPVGGNLDAAKCFSDAGGTITVVNEVPVLVIVKDINTQAVISGVRVRVVAGSGGPLTLGTVIISGTTDVSGEIEGVIRYSASQPVVGSARKHSAAPYYQEVDIVDAVGSSGQTINVFMIPDE